ncbi:MAG: hypothetical protein ABI120_20270 [Gemmatimonadaceae bacterium]
MDLTSEIATREEAGRSPFGAILRETIAEMQTAESGDLAFEDMIQRLSLAAHAAVAAQSSGRLPRVGGHAYHQSTVTPPAKIQPQLDVRY